MQLLPSPEKPGKQVQVCEPIVLSQVALKWHGEVALLHSLISKGKMEVNVTICLVI